MRLGARVTKIKIKITPLKITGFFSNQPHTTLLIFLYSNTLLKFSPANGGVNEKNHEISVF